MEIKYKILGILFLIGIILSLRKKETKKEKEIKKIKIANTEFIENTPYYQSLKKKYHFYKKLLYFSYAVAILSSLLLCTRLQKEETKKESAHKRDIVLCMDVSSSVDQLNIELIKDLENTVDSLKGERFGISIFNTTSILISPLTDDYQYTKTSLEEIEKSLKANNSYQYGPYTGEDYYSVINYIYNGTLEGNETRGSSLIGDGLASCIQTFSNLEEERTRIIIFTTDNALEGKPLLTLEEAAEIGKEKKIIVYGISTDNITKENKEALKNAVEMTNGKLYEDSNKTDKIVKEIEKTSKTLVESKIEKEKVDQPLLPLLGLLFSFIAILLIRKKVVS